MASNLHDTHRYLQFNLTHTGSDEDFHYLDIAKMLSAVNRRTYRQGMMYHIANIVFHDAEKTALIRTCTAPNTWALQSSWRMAFEHWFQQQSAAAEVANTEFGPWHDFKVELNDDMLDDVDQATFIDTEGNTLLPGEWVYSTLEVPQIDGSGAPVKAELYLMGSSALSSGSYNKLGLMREFEKLINAPQADPDISEPGDSAYALLAESQPDSQVITEVMESLDADNDLPPYDPEQIPGALTASGGVNPSAPWIVRTCNTNSGLSAVGGFTAPCGLVCFETKDSNDGNIIGVTVELTPGSYKGVSAVPMSGGGF